jgi:hypothetical protein
MLHIQKRDNFLFDTFGPLVSFVPCHSTKKKHKLFKEQSHEHSYQDWFPIRLFRIMSIPITFRLFRVLSSEMLGRLLPVFMLLL